MKTARSKNIRKDAGQTLVEFALVAILFFAIIFGIIEFGRFWFYSNHLNNSVRAAARYAAVLGSASPPPTSGAAFYSDVVAYLTTEIAGTMPIDTTPPITITVTLIPTDGSAPSSPPSTIPSRGDTIEVTVDYPFTVLSGSIIPFFSGAYTIERSATMRYEG